MHESFNKIATIFSTERRREIKDAHTEKLRRIEERERQYNAWVQETDNEFAQLESEKLYRGTSRYIAEKFRQVHSSTRGLVSLEAVEKQIRQNSGQQESDIYVWMNTASRQVQSVDNAFYNGGISEETKQEIERDLFSLFGSVSILQIQQTLEDKYGIEITSGPFSIPFSSSGNK